MTLGVCLDPELSSGPQGLLNPWLPAGPQEPLAEEFGAGFWGVSGKKEV